MAELQWVIEVRCVNALLAQIKVGERGQHFIVEVPAGDFDPSEFAKLIEGVESAKALGNEQYKKSEWKTTHDPMMRPFLSDTTQPPLEAKIIEKRELYDIKLLDTGELALVTINHAFFAPSELNRFLLDLKKAQQQMERLGKTAKSKQKV